MRLRPSDYGMTADITRWVCHRCKTDVWRGAPKETEETPPGAGDCQRAARRPEIV
jgi:hypothetical protein